MAEEIKQSMEPVEKTSAVVAPAGISGLNRAAGLGLVEEEFLPELRGRQAVDKYTEMWMNDAIASAMLFAIDMFMRRTAWRAEAAGDEARFQEDQQFLSECMDDMSHTWQDLIAEINSMLAYGWSYLELLYKRRTTEAEEGQDPPSKFNDGRIGWRKIEIRSQTSFDSWKFDDEGGIAGMVQRAAPDYKERFIPIQKALLFRTTSRRNSPEGVSVLRSAYRSYYFKKRIEEIEGVGIERDLAGLPMAEVPASMLRPNATDDEKAMLKSILTLVGQVRRDQAEGVIWPVEYDNNGNKMFSFSLLSASGSRQFSTGEVITRYEQRMAMTVLADFILLGNSDSSGSFAMSTTKSGMFQSALSAWMDGIEAVLNNYAVPRLFRLNGRPGPYPKIRHEDVHKPSIADLATFVSAMVGAGAQLFPDVELENALRETAKLPLRGEDLPKKNKEDELRDQKVDTDIEIARAQQKQAKEGIVPSQTGGQNPLGKQPDAVPGAPTPSTGEVRSKLPPRQRRTTAAVNAAANVRKAIIQKKERSSKKPQSCKYCSSPATKSLLWAEGMAYIPACDKHEKKARARIVITNRDEVAAVHDVRQK